MASMPREPEAFAEQVVQMLRRLRPELDVRLSGPSEAMVDGRRLDLENLRRLVAQSPQRGAEIVEQFLESLLSEHGVELEAIPGGIAQRLIMPRIHPESVFEHLDERQVAYTPFVNGTVVLFVLDLPEVTVTVTADQMVRWGVSPDDLERFARLNLRSASADLQVQIVESEEGGRAAVMAQRDGYDASRLLLADLHTTLAPELGGDFLVATPARDMFVAISQAPEPFVERIHDRVERDYRRLPYPITTDFFYVTQDGVAGVGPSSSPP